MANVHGHAPEILSMSASLRYSPTVTKLPEYSDNDIGGSICVKCGSHSASTRYLPFGQCLHPGDETARGVIIRMHQITGLEANERLHRECYRCGHCWDESVI
jgi:Zn ribbon nucleic-acid-binding protein